MYLIWTQQQDWVPALVLIISGECTYVAHTQNSFHYFRMVVTHVTFDLVAVAAFLESSKLPTID